MGKLHLNSLPEEVPQEETKTVKLNQLPKQESKVEDLPGEPTNSTIIDSSVVIEPVGFETPATVESYALKRDQYGMWRIINKSGKGKVPEMLSGGYSDTVFANSTIALYVALKNTGKLKD